MKKCIKCKIEKPLVDYNKRNTTKDGVDTRCRECVNKRRRDNIRQNPNHIAYTKKHRKIRSDYVSLKKQSGCVRCGYSKCEKALTFHHIDQTTKIDTIANLVSRLAKLEVIEEEIQKCILLCFNCHAELHEEEKDYGVNNKYKKNLEKACK